MDDKEMVDCAEPGRQMERLRAIMHRLRAPGGCPWDAEQTHQSLVAHLIEETYETVDTIQRGDMNHLREELGDLLLQVVFHSEIAEENGHFDFDAVAQEVSEKLVRRHPHVYGDSVVEGTEGVLSQWDAIKRQEKGNEEKPFLHAVGDGLPGLLRAAKLQKKASKVGFDWPDARAILSKVREELDEVEAELAEHERTGVVSAELEAEIGDLLFVAVNVARKLKVNPEVAIGLTNQKFLTRFSQVESALKAQGRTLEEASIDEMEALWQLAK